MGSSSKHTHASEFSEFFFFPWRVSRNGGMSLMALKRIMNRKSEREPLAKEAVATQRTEARSGPLVSFCLFCSPTCSFQLLRVKIVTEMIVLCILLRCLYVASAEPAGSLKDESVCDWRNESLGSAGNFWIRCLSGRSRVAFFHPSALGGKPSIDSLSHW